MYSTILGGGSTDWGLSIAVDTAGSAYITGTTLSSEFPLINAYQSSKSFSTEAFVSKIPSNKFSTFLGGEGSDVGLSVAVDDDGDIIIVGYTDSIDFPILNSYQTHQGRDDIFVTKLRGSTNSIIFSTYIGGGNRDFGLSADIDLYGNIYITGQTTSFNFPLVNPYSTYTNGNSVFVTKLNSTGNGLKYSTFIGEGIPWSIKVDTIGNAYITGYTFSTDFPTLNSFQGQQGGSDVFVTKLNFLGNGLVYSTYLGGNNTDQANGIAIDSAGNAYITGYTRSTDFPTLNPYQNHQGSDDVFVTKLNSTGNGLIYSTFLGGNITDQANGIAIDSAGNAYITGSTDSSNFPTLNPYQKDQAGAFVTKLNSTGNGLVYSTILTGEFGAVSRAITIDSDHNAYITGYTSSSDFPILNSFQAQQGSIDVFALKLNSTGNGLVYSTYLGGNQTDKGYGIAIDSSGSAYIMGSTISTDFPIVNSYQTALTVENIFIFKFHTDIDSEPPSVQLNGLVNNSVIDSNGYVNLQIIEPISLIHEVLYNWDGSANQTLNPPYRISTSISEGSHILNVFAKDTAGNWGIQIFIFGIDDTPPMIFLDNPINLSIIRSGTSINLDVTDLNLDSVYYNWDGNVNQSLNPPFRTAMPMGDGNHTLNLYANDIAGNWKFTVYLFKTDDTSPQIQLLELGNSTVLNSNSEIKLNIVEENLLQVLYNWDSSMINTTLIEQPILLPEGDGVHLLNVFVQDEAGNWAYTIFHFVTDDTGPSINFSDPYQLFILQSGVIIEFIIDDLNNVAEISFRWDQALSYDIFTDISDITTPLGDGNHTLYILARDDVGNEIEVSFEFTIDNTVPNLEVSGIQQLATLTKNTTVDVTVSDINGIVKVEFYLDDDLVSTQTDPEYSLIINPENLENKQYDLQIWAYDPAGNIAKSETIKFTINNPEETTPSDGSSGLPSEVLLGILVASGLAVSTATFRFIRRRKMDKAFDDLEVSFEDAEDTGRGKVD